ncbi:MAG: HAMP domain-containing sensor histidine kinase [Minicystis sp.]
MPAPPSSPGYRLRARLLVVIGLLVALVFAGGAATVLTALASRSAIARAHDLELASRRAALLSVIAREQYIHEAHTIILRDRSHVGHHDEWVSKLASELAELRRDASEDGDARLDAIGRASHELSGIFASAILPAIDRQDWSEVARAHDRANAVVDRMTSDADALADHFERRAMEAEADAARVIRIALGISMVVGALAAALAVIFGRRLWSSFSGPLASLERVAQQVAAGDREARVGPLAARELAVVGDAFNRMLDALARAEAELVTSERLAAIGRIAAGVAHEINNPITIIRGYVKTMRHDAQSEELRDELRILDEEAMACQRIAEDLLTYTRSPALEPRPVDAAEIIQDAAERCEGAPSRRLAEEGAPPVEVDAEPVTISVDPLRVRQVVVNLLTNAREATTGREPVRVVGRRVDDGYRIEVLDRGPGISDAARAHLFEPFFTTRRDGTGLGLAVCYGLVTAHGGKIRVEPRSGGGSRFVVDLPGVLVDERKRERERA